MPDKPTYFTMPDGHPNAVYSVAFMPDGKRVVSGSLDHAIKIWDVAKKTAVVREFPVKKIVGSRTVTKRPLRRVA